MMKRFFLSICFLIFISGMFQGTFANSDDASLDTSHCINSTESEKCIKNAYIKTIIGQKVILRKQVINGESYITKLDSFFASQKDNTQALLKVRQRVLGAMDQLGTSKKHQDVRQVLLYIMYRIDYILLDVEVQQSVVSVEINSEGSDIDISFLYGTEEEFANHLNNLSLEDMERIGKFLYIDEPDVYNQLTGNTPGSRDNIRVNDIEDLAAAVETIYQDTNEYPTQDNFYELVNELTVGFPQDPFAGYIINGCDFGYKYEVGTGKYGINNSRYRISTCFETQDYIQAYANNSIDNGVDDLRLELSGWNEGIIPTESFYINNISSWQPYVDPNQNRGKGSVATLDQSDKQSFLYQAIYYKYIEYSTDKLEKNTREAQLSKVQSDMRVLITLFEIANVKGEISQNEIIGTVISEYSDAFGDMKIGYFNDVLITNGGGLLEDWRYMGDNRYIVAYVETEDRFLYQLLGFSQAEGDKKIAVIKGNLNQDDLPSLFIDTRSGKHIVDGDVFENISVDDIETITGESNQTNDLVEKLTGTVTLDTNHAFAGKTLNFDVEIMKIDKADGNTSNMIEKGDNIEVHYNGTLEDGEKFDSSYDRGQTLPFTVGAGQMIAGFDAGVVGMKLKEKKTLVLSPAEAYGEYDDTRVQVIPKSNLESFVAAGYKLEVGEKLPTQMGQFEIIAVTDK